MNSLITLVLHACTGMRSLDRLQTPHSDLLCGWGRICHMMLQVLDSPRIPRFKSVWSKAHFCSMHDASWGVLHVLQQMSILLHTCLRCLVMLPTSNFTCSCSEVMEEYQRKMKELSEWLLILILKSLGTAEERIEWLRSEASHGGPAPCTALQLNSYPPCPDPAQAMGLAPHTDSFLLTVLHQVSSIHGLQVLKEGAGWLRVVPVEGALVVNVGDMLHVLSNALFPSVRHRVLANKTSHRMSIAYFYGPPVDYRLSPVPSGCPSRVHMRFRPVTVREYIEMKAKNLEGALSRIRVRWERRKTPIPHTPHPGRYMHPLNSNNGASRVLFLVGIFSMHACHARLESRIGYSRSVVGNLCEQWDWFMKVQFIPCRVGKGEILKFAYNSE